MKHNIDALDAQLNEYFEILTWLSDQERLRQLLIDWRRPGWTTPAEFLLVSGLLTSMTSAAKQLGELQNTLIEGSQLVGR